VYKDVNKNTNEFYQKELIGTWFIIKTEIDKQNIFEKKYIILDTEIVEKYFLIEKETGIRLDFYNLEQNSKVDFIYPKSEINLLIKERILVEEDFFDEIYVKITTILI